jgi:UDP-N-acetylglucosamine diphosphorylase/glucosamine-1-phosphate N-acetyltransferase
MPDPEKWGIFQTDDQDNLISLIEKPKEYIGNLANIGLYLLNTDIFDLFDQIPLSVRGEYEITDSITLFAKNHNIKVLKGDWQPLGYPWHIFEVHEKLISEIAFDVHGDTEENVNIKGRIKLGKNSIIKSGCYIEGDVIIGENCVIGPNAYIRGTTVIGNNCKVGNAVEIKNSILFDGSCVPHLNYVGDSVLGKNVNFSAGCITSNKRHDRGNIKTLVKGNLVDTNMKKFGTVIGDNSKLGIGTKIYPGRKIGPDMTTLPGEIVTKDKTN